MNHIKTIRRGLILGVSAVGGIMAGYGRALAQTASNCTLSGDTYTCTGTASTTQSITLNSTATKIATQPPFQIAVPSGGSFNNAFGITGAGTFTDTNASQISADSTAFSWTNSSAGNVILSSNGTIKSTSASGFGTGIQVDQTGVGHVTLDVANVLGTLHGIAVRTYAGDGGINITVSGQQGVIGGRGSGIYALTSSSATGDLVINATNVSGNYGINAVNRGTGSLSVTTSGQVTQETINNPPARYDGTVSGRGAISVAGATNNKNVTVATAGPVSFGTIGIYARNAGTGTLTVTASGAMQNQISSTGSGILAIGNIGAVSAHLTSTGSINATEGIRATSNGGDITVTIDGKITGTATTDDLTTNQLVNVQQGGAGIIKVDVNADVIDPTGKGGGISIDSAMATSAATVHIAQGVTVESGSGLNITSRGNDVNVTIDGTVIGRRTPYNKYVGSAISGLSGGAGGTKTIQITQTGKVQGVIGFDSTGPGGEGLIVLNNAGTITGRITTNNPTQITNMGSIVNTGDPANPDAIRLLRGGQTVNLQAGAVTGDVTINGKNAEGASTVNWTGGTLNGGIRVTADSNQNPVANVVNLRSLDAAKTATLSHLQGAGNIDTLNLDNVQLKGGSFNDDLTKGTAIQGWQRINLTNGSTLSLSGNLLATNFAANPATVNVDQQSTLRVLDGVNATLGAANLSETLAVSVVNAGTLDLSSATVGKTVTINGNYTQASTGKLVIGVTPTAADTMVVNGNVSLAGRVSVAWAPGTYVAGTRTVIHATGALSGTVDLASVAGSTAPSIGVRAGYTANDFNLVIGEGGTPPSDGGTTTPPSEGGGDGGTTPPVDGGGTVTPPVVAVAPTDSRIYSAQTFAFASANEGAAMELLGRTEADGGGNTFYNLGINQGQKVRSWMEVGGDQITADARGSTTHFRSNSGVIQAGADAAVGDMGRFGVSLGYQRFTLDDSAGGRATTDAIRASIYGSYSLGPVGVSAMAGYAHGFDTTQRETGIGPATAQRGTNQWLAAGQLSLPVTLSAIRVTPTVGAIVSRITGGNFSEDGAVVEAFRVTGEILHRTFVSPFVKLGVSTVFETAGGGQWIPDVSVGYRRSNVAIGTDYVLVAADNTRFAGNRVDLDRNTVLVGASLTAHRGAWTGAFKYRGQFASGRQDNQGSFVLRYAF